MTIEEELEELQREALEELGVNDDADENDSEQEESAGGSTNNEETGDNQENNEEDGETADTESSTNEVNEEEAESEEEEDFEDETKEEEENEEVTDFKPIEIDILGQKVTIDSQDELMKFLKKGVSAESNPKKLPPSEAEQIMLQGKLTEKDLALIIDAKNGNKFAIAKLAKESGIDINEVLEDDAENYTQKFQPKVMSEVDMVAEEILSDNDWKTKFQETLQSVPEDFIQDITVDPERLRNFGEHVKSGLAQRIIPLAIKSKILNGGTFLENYAKVGRRVTQEDTVPKKRKISPRAKEMKRRAVAPKGSTESTKKETSGDDIWNMSDKEFEKKYG